MVMNELLDRYVAEHVPTLTPRVQRDYGSIMVYLRASFGQMQAQDVKPGHIREFLDVEKGRVHRNRMVMILSHMFGKAITDWRIDDVVNPCANIKRWPTTPRNRVVTDEELHTFRSDCPVPVQLAMDLASLTPLGQKEILGLMWQQVNMAGARTEWVINPDGKRAPIPITPHLATVLIRARSMKPESPRQYVIRTKYGDRFTEDGFRAKWQRHMGKHVKAGRPRFNFLDLQQKGSSDSASLPPTLTHSPLSARRNSKIFWASIILEDHIPTPGGISPETLADEARSIYAAGPDGDCIVVYCCINECGAIYWMGRRIWSMWAPIGPAEFVTLLATNNVNPKNPKAFAEWRKANLNHRATRGKDSSLDDF